MILMNPASLKNERGLPASGPLAGHSGAGCSDRHAVMSSFYSLLPGISCFGNDGIKAAAGASHRGRRQQSQSGIGEWESHSVNLVLGTHANPGPHLLMNIVFSKTGIAPDPLIRGLS